MSITGLLRLLPWIGRALWMEKMADADSRWQTQWPGHLFACSTFSIDVYAGFNEAKFFLVQTAVSSCAT